MYYVILALILTLLRVAVVLPLHKFYVQIETNGLFRELPLLLMIAMITENDKWFCAVLANYWYILTLSDRLLDISVCLYLAGSKNNDVRDHFSKV